jgi:hypothetical protein
MEEGRYSSIILNLALDGGDWSASCHCHFSAGEIAPVTHCTEGWVDPKASLDVMEKGKISCPYQESNSDSQVLQPLA